MRAPSPRTPPAFSRTPSSGKRPEARGASAPYAPPTTPRIGMNRLLNIVGVVAFATSLFTRAVDPVVPQIANDLLVETATAALLSTAFALPYAALQPVLGPIADVVGKTRVMVVS